MIEYIRKGLELNKDIFSGQYVGGWMVDVGFSGNVDIAVLFGSLKI